MFQVYIKEFTTLDGRTVTRLRVFQGEFIDKLEFKGQLFIDGRAYHALLHQGAITNAKEDDT